MYKAISVWAVALQLFFSGLSFANQKQSDIDTFKSDIAYFQSYIDKNRIDELSPQLVDRLEFNLIQITFKLNNNELSDDLVSEYSQLELQTYNLIQYFRPDFKAQLSEIKKINNNDQNIKTTNENDAYIKGTVRDSITFEPIEGAIVQYDNEDSSDFTYTNEDGQFSLLNIWGSHYPFYVTALSHGYEDQGYENIPCENGCDEINLTPIYLGINDSVENINFQLKPLGTISGTVINSDGESIYGFVDVYDDSYNLVASGNNLSDENEMYHIEIPKPGDYYVSIRGVYYIQELYPDVACSPECDFSQAQKITVNNDHIVLDPVELTLNKLISGKIFDQANNQIIDSSISQRVELIDASSGQVVSYSLSSYFDENDNWFLRWYPGEYFIRASAQNYIAQYTDLQNCDGESFDSCNVSNLNPTVYQHNHINDIENVNFYLDKGGEVSGYVYQPDSVTLADAWVGLYDETGELIEDVTTINGHYVFGGLGNGTYYLSASSNDYYDTAFPSQYCQRVEYDSSECSDIELISTPIQINNYNQSNNNNIILKEAAKITGVVRDDHGQPLGDIRVRALGFDSYFDIIDSAITDEFGVYELKGLSFGDIYLYSETSYYDQIYYREFYQDVPCDVNLMFCDPQNATPINLNQAITYDGYDINLTKKAALSIDYSRPLFTIEGTISIYNGQGEFVMSEQARTFTSPVFLPEGNYRLVYEGDISSKYISKVYGGDNCFQECDPMDGVIINIQNNQEYNLSMNLDESFQLELILPEHVNDQHIEIYSENTLIYRERSLTTVSQPLLNLNVNGEIKAGLQINGYPYQFYNNVECNDLTCALALAEPINTNPNGYKQIVFNQVMSPLTVIEGVVQGSSGEPIANASVELYKTNAFSPEYTVFTDQSGYYKFEAIEEAQYHAYVTESYAYRTHVGSLYGGELCMRYEECNLNNSNIITVENDHYLSDINFTMPKAGTVQIENVQYTNGDAVTESEFWFYRWIDGRYQFHEARELFDNVALIESLDEDTYRIMAVQKIHGTYIKTVYPNVDCSGMDSQTCLAQGTDVDVMYNQPIVIDDFVINQPAAIKLHVQDQDTGAYLTGYTAKLYVSNASFGYPIVETIDGSVTNLYVSHEQDYVLYIESSETLPHEGMLYDSINCNRGINIDCQLEQGTPIRVELGQFQEIFMTLPKKPQLQLNIKDSITQGTVDSNVDLKIYNDTESLLMFNSQTNGHFVYNLNPGTYYFVAESDEHNIKAYPDSICPFLQLDWCESGYTSIEVTEDGNSSYNLFLDLKSGYTGFVLEADTGLPRAGVKVDVWDAHSNDFESGITGANGSFSIYAPYTVGYISTDVGGSSDLIDEIYDNISCYDGPVSMGLCDISQGTVGTLDFTPLIVFELDKDEIFSHGFE